MNLMVWGAAAGFLGVALGAFGAHALKPVLTSYGREIWNTAVLYHLVHSGLAAGTGFLFLKTGQRWFKLSSLFFLTGITLFSGSLYLLALSGIKPLGMVTPFGGVAFLAGWALLGTGGFKLKL